MRIDSEEMSERKTATIGLIDTGTEARGKSSGAMATLFPPRRPRGGLRTLSSPTRHQLKEYNRPRPHR
jgi:hypothetical protein